MMVRHRERPKLDDPLRVAPFDADGALNVAIDPEQVSDGRAGMILADFSRHVADMPVDVGTADAATVTAGIDAGMREELGTPTDTPTGRTET